MKKTSLKGLLVGGSIALILSGCSVNKQTNHNHLNISELKFIETDNNEKFLLSESLNTALREKFLSDRPILEKIDYNANITEQLLEKCGLFLNSIYSSEELNSFTQYFITNLQKSHDESLTVNDIYGFMYHNKEDKHNYNSMDFTEDSGKYEMNIFTDVGNGMIYEDVNQSCTSENLRFSKDFTVSQYNLYNSEKHDIRNDYYLEFDDTAISLWSSYRIIEEFDISPKNYNCRNFEAKLKIEDDKIDPINKEISEEEYDFYADLLFNAYKNRTTKEQFFTDNNEIFEQLLGEDYKKIKPNNSKKLVK